MVVRVRHARDGAALVITVDRPNARNAISIEVAQALSDALDEARRDDAVHAVVLTSTGSVFLSGGDLRQLSALPADSSGAERVMAMGEQLAAIERCPLPVIAAVHGDVIGGGCELLLMCDVVVMERRAGMRFVHARMGLTPAWGGTTRLLERVGATRAAELLLTARRIDAAQAHAIGLVARLCDDGEARDEAQRIVDGLAAIPRAALINIKRSLLAARSARRDAFAAEREVFEDAWGSPQHLAAFEALARHKQA